MSISNSVIQMAVMTGTYFAMDRMSLKNGGSGGLIINTSSAAGIVFGNAGEGMAKAESYFVAKHGVVALTRALGVGVVNFTTNSFENLM